jgi:predicted Rossmann fold flavoprotein
MEKDTNAKFDLVIVGGGAAGILAAISAKKYHPDYSICIIDRTFALGRKILVSGAGRCNITNINLTKASATSYYGASPDFIASVFDQFSCDDIIKFFNDLGIETYIESKNTIGKVFPISEQAKSVTMLLADELNRLGIEVFLNEESRIITKHGDTFIIETNQQKISSKYVILSTGGMTYPALGSDGSGYNLAKAFGHEIIEPVPAALPLTAKSPLCHDLQGVKMKVTVSAVIDDKPTRTRTDDLIFAQYGFSGSGILNISREVSLHFNREHKNNAYLIINFFPDQTAEQVKTLMETNWQKRPDQSIEKSLFGFMPIKLPAAILKTININPETQVKNFSEKERDQIIAIFTSFKVRLTGTRGWNEAEFTAGGVDTTEIKSKTLESTLCPGLYLCGEILNVDGDIGGYNLSWAWSSGYVAGKLS